MGDRIDYRTKNKKKINKKLKIVLIIILVIIIIYFLVQSFIRAYKSVTPQTTEESELTLHFSADEFSSLEELLASYNCTYISELETSSLLKVYVSFDRDLYTDDESNERFFTNLIYLIADFEDYKSFELVDEVRDIDIVVTCEDSAIVQIEINGDINYYLNQDSKLNSQKDKANVTDLEIESEELQALIDNDWIPTDLDLGTKDSTCDNYEIYFDEGFEYKVVGRQVYNFIFTEKYSGNIVSGLNINSTAEEIEATLGEATFQQGTSLYGYIGDNCYVFFDFENNQISIYPVQTMTEEEEQEFIELVNEMNESLDIKQFSMDLTSLWTDYDIYDYDSDYVDLQYTLKGIELTISSSSLKNGVYIYQNYSGDFDIADLDNVYIQDEDAVFAEEEQRIINEKLKTTIEGELSDEERAKIGTKFYIYFRGTIDIENGYKSGPTFYSSDKEYPDTELDKTLKVSSFYWYDDYNFVYSVDDDGIYVFNCISNANVKILDIDGEIEINSAGDGVIIYNETEKINVNIE